jgi:hypothetical protein
MGKAVIDLLLPVKETMQAVFSNAVQVGRSHRMPDLEMALIGKFAGFALPERDVAKKLNDAGDFCNMVVTNPGKFDLAKLRNLAARVCRGGGKRILGLVDDIKADRRITV